MKNKFDKRTLIAACALLASALFGIVVATFPRTPTVTQQQDTSYVAPAPEKNFGSSYEKNSALSTVLFLGVDYTKALEEDDVLGDGGRSDVMGLIILNDETKTMQMLEISRDTMVMVQAYDEDDEFLYEAYGQITLQYHYGSTPKRSCWLTKNKVSELLMGTDINATASFTMEGIAPMVELMGGLEITIPQDYTMIDPSFVKGATVHLDGAMAEKYIRYRDITEFGSNNTRMERHIGLLKALITKVRSTVDADTLEKLQTFATPYMESDLDADIIEKLMSYTLEDEILYIPGENVAGEKHDEYHIDSDALEKLILETFYVQK